LFIIVKHTIIGCRINTPGICSWQTAHQIVLKKAKKYVCNSKVLQEILKVEHILNCVFTINW